MKCGYYNTTQVSMELSVGGSVKFNKDKTLLIEMLVDEVSNVPLATNSESKVEKVFNLKNKPNLNDLSLKIKQL